MRTNVGDKPGISRYSGLNAFTGDRRQDGTYSIPAGGSLIFRYRVFIHHGNPLQAGVAEAYGQFAAEK